MRIYLDDEREPPTKREMDDTPLPPWDAWCKHADEAIALLKTGKVTFIDLDHYLWSGELTGLEVAQWILEEARKGDLPRLDWDVHSGHRGRCMDIYRVMSQADEVWNDFEKQQRADDHAAILEGVK